MLLRTLLFLQLGLCLTAFGDVSLEIVGPAGSFEYVNECKQAGVEVPEALDCEKGTEVPIWKTLCKNGKNERIRVTEENYMQLLKEANENILTCDNPAYLHFTEKQSHQACRPGSRLQYIAGKNGTQCMMFCRKYTNSPKEYYEDINMICHQPKNGATCFFNSKMNQSHSGKDLKSPAIDMRWAGASQIALMRPVSNCVHCHDSDPFLVSPHIAELGIVPSSDTKVRRNLKGKYYVVGREYQTDAWQKVYTVNSPEATACTQCHRIGSRGTCQYWLPLFTGHLDQRKINYHAAETRGCGGSRQPRFMPPGGGFSLRDQEAVRFISECCSEVNQPDFPKQDSKCGWRKVDARADSASDRKGQPPSRVGGKPTDFISH